MLLVGFVGTCSSERPGAVQGAPIGAAERTARTVLREWRQEGKESSGGRFLKRNKRYGCRVATMIYLRLGASGLFGLSEGAYGALSSALFRRVKVPLALE
jgi:hypothetical protein